MPLPDSVAELVARFQSERKEYHKGHYNETQTRIDYVNPLFAARGWDMDNREGLSELLRDVVHEDAIKIGGTTKAPDYSFRVAGTRKFFVETKKPSVHLYLLESPAFQLRRYGWTVKMPLSILTNFEEFAIYDTRVPPNKKDAAKTARLDYFKYTDYASKWDEIAARFSQEALLSGAFDQYAAGARDKRISVPVDVAFLAEISGWRDKLARNIVANNPGLSPRELNYAVQMIIDRLIFLRISEDRGVEPEFLLQPLMNRGGPVYPRLLDIFHRADARYNSGLFHFKTEPGREGPDDVTPRLTIDDRPLKEIIASVYYPESPFEFSVFPADILGQVYEQFLGKVIRISGKTAEVEDKPEVKKAGGVYYTPTYVVDYIVRHTVGMLVDGKTPAQVAKLTILDPACGSGSFLLGAYQFLLDWHLKYYTENDRAKWARGKNATIYLFKKDTEGVALWRLTTVEKKRILLNNLYGVDIDAQAVEVTKLSLLLKVLENESAELIDNSLKLFQERALPNLESNIQCGNSLIGPDFYDGKDFADFDLDTRLKINAFDWKAAFSKVMIGGGFDTVIGNPPYTYRNSTQDLSRSYYLQHFASAEGNYELYKFFLERSLSLAKKKGLIGFIVSATFLVQPTFTKLRKVLLEHSAIQRIVALGPNVFTEATVDTAILVAENGKALPEHEIAVLAPLNPIEITTTEEQTIQQSRFAGNKSSNFDYRLGNAAAKIVDRLLQTYPNIETGFEFGVGINTGYIRNEIVAAHKADHRYHPMVAGTGISRYGLIETTGWIMYDKEYVRSKGSLGRTLPAEHLLSSDKILVVRTRNFSLPRRIIASIDRNGCYNLNRLSNIVARPSYSLFGMLGILNSALFNWLFSTRFYDYEIKPIYLRISPLADVNNNSLIGLVEQMLTLHKDKAGARLGQEKAMIQQEIEATDAQIDRLVYDLYGLTEDEIKIVEAG